METVIGCPVTTFDLGIFAVTAVIFLALGWWVSRRSGGDSGPSST